MLRKKHGIWGKVRMKYLVTGGAGFIGSHIVERLVAQGEKLRLIDNFSTGKRENLAGIVGKIEIIKGDIRNYKKVREAVDDRDIVLHQAALPSVPRSIKDPLTTNEVNVGGTLNVLKAAVDAAVRRIVFASSSSVYGGSEKIPKFEGLPPYPFVTLCCFQACRRELLYGFFPDLLVGDLIPSLLQRLRSSTGPRFAICSGYSKIH